MKGIPDDLRVALEQFGAMEQALRGFQRIGDVLKVAATLHQRIADAEKTLLAREARLAALENELKERREAAENAFRGLQEQCAQERMRWNTERVAAEQTNASLRDEGGNLHAEVDATRREVVRLKAELASLEERIERAREQGRKAMEEALK